MGMPTTVLGTWISAPSVYLLLVLLYVPSGEVDSCQFLDTANSHTPRLPSVDITIISFFSTSIQSARTRRNDLTVAIHQLALHSWWCG